MSFDQCQCKYPKDRGASGRGGVVRCAYCGLAIPGASPKTVTPSRDDSPAKPSREIARVEPSLWGRIRGFLRWLRRLAWDTDGAYETGSSGTSAGVRRRASAAGPRPRISSSLASSVDTLARQAWRSAETLSLDRFVLAPETLERRDASLDGLVTGLLAHARVVAPGFDIPHHVPRVRFTSLQDAAGTFAVDGHGWTSIDIHPRFQSNARAVRAILAHEVCHYILENSGIRRADTAELERLTDVCMFVCGLGWVFVDGYLKQSDSLEYSPGHRLGYLSDADYKSINEYVLYLRRTNDLSLPRASERLFRELVVLTGDERSAQRLVRQAKSRFPSEEEAIEYVILQLERDRR